MGNVTENTEIDVPKFAMFREAFLYAWDRGVGLESDAPGCIPRPWTLSDMEHAFETRGKYVSDKTVEN